MAERRMFAKSIIDSDFFLDMPLTAQALYFHLSMRADDEGFVSNPKKIQRMIGAGDDDMKLLIAKHYLLTFDSGIVVVTHWRLHNYLQSDRVKETLFLDEKSMLQLDENKVYVKCIQNVYITDTNRIQNVSKLDTKCIHSIDKSSIGKVSVEENSNCLLKILKEKISDAGMYTGVHDDLINEALDALIDGTKLTKPITYNGNKYDAHSFEQIIKELKVPDLCLVLNRLLQSKGSISDRKRYIQGALADIYIGQWKKK